MDFQSYMNTMQNEINPNNPERDVPTKPDKNPDPTKPKPGGNEPKKNDPTRIEEPQKSDPTRISLSQTRPRPHKLTKVNSWNEALEKMQGVLEK
jgi:hypothetical protein